MSHQNLIKITLLTILLSLIALFTIYYHQQFNIRDIQAMILSYGFWAPLVFISFSIFATIFFLPGSILIMAGGLIFGAIWGAVYNFFGTVIGATCSFLIARYLASEWVEHKMRGQLKELLDGVAREGWRFVAVVRLMPIFPFNLLNYALGLTRIRLVAYVLASAVFMLPAIIVYTYIGSLGETFIHGNAREMITRVSIAMGLLILMASIPWLVKQCRLS